MILKYDYFRFVLMVSVVLLLALVADTALASTAGPGGGTGLQWETPIQTIVRSISGPVAWGFLVLGLLAIAFKLVWGGDMDAFLRSAIYFVMVGSLIAFAVGIIGGVMFAGATI